MTDRLSPILLGKDAWIRHQPHRGWLEMQGRRLLDFSKEGCIKGGFAGLDMEGRLPEGAKADATLTARCVHAYAVGAIQGVPGSAPLVAHGVEALLNDFRDREHGGWNHFADEPKGRKEAYLHAFVGLAGSSATRAGIEGGKELLSKAIEAIEGHFWSEKEGVMLDTFAYDWSDPENYRGANSNMHSTEAFMALADVTGNVEWLHRALRIVTRFVHELASQQGFAMPEHFDENWTLLPDYHKDQPTHDLRPYGMTPGHFVEWSHLTLKLEAALLRHGISAPGWMLHDAQALFETGVKTGWNVDGHKGFVYTIDWEHKPHVHARVHWAHAEALTAAINLYKRTGNAVYEQWYQKIWNYIDRVLIDRKHGSWLNETNPEGQPTETIYKGKADLYHAFQSTLAPVMPLAPSLATAVAQMGVPY